jgi:hypothetical protein
MNAPATEELEREVAGQVDSGVLAVISKAEIDMQIATAHRFPRSLKGFRDEALAMVTLTEEIADECVYALPRDGKTIEGPSARFAEVIVSAWGNCRAGARVVDDQGDFVTAQGVFHDLQKNVAITYEVRRRIVDKRGVRFKPDMIGVTANAACSIALRNAILKGVPKAFWSSIYDAARQTIMGDYKTLANRRAAALAAFQKFGVVPEKVFANLGVRGEEDITLEHLVTLRGMLTALKEGDSTPEQMFPEPKEPGERSASASLKSAATNGAAKKDTQPEPQPAEGGAGQVTVIDAIAKLESFADQESMALYVDQLPTEVKQDERLTKAFKKRCDALKEPKAKK